MLQGGKFNIEVEAMGQGVSGGKRKYEVYPDYKHLLPAYAKADQESLNAIESRDIPEGKKLVLLKFKETIAA